MFVFGLFLCLSGRFVSAFQSPRTSLSIIRQGSVFGTLKENASTTTANGKVLSPSVGDTFTSDVMKVFIEDTDTYGVVYNANYLKFYDRALQTARSLSSIRHSDDVIVSVGNQKFRSSPSLGDEFVIEGVLNEVDEAERHIWDLSMKSVDRKTTYHSAESVVVTTPQNEQWLSQVEAFQPKEGSSYEMADSFVAYRDEFDPSMSSHMPLTSVLNHFERPRTNFFGGPKELRRLQEEDGIVVVVSGIKDLCLLEHDNDFLIGDTLTVKTFCEIRKGGMRSDLYQTIYTSSGTRLAQGVVTLYTLNKETFRPTSKLPQRLLDRLQGIISK